jgi:ABC-type uncharacterized transport system substrate-binding protein
MRFLRFLFRSKALMRAWLAGCVTLLILLTPVVAVAAETITVVLSERGGIYSEFSDAFNNQLAQGEARRTVRPLLANGEQIDAAELSNSSVIVAVGASAARAVAKTSGSAPVLCVLVPRPAFERIAESAKRPRSAFSAIYLDQPLARQLSLIRLALPGKHKVGVLTGPDAKGQLGRLRNAAARSGFELQNENADDENAIVPALNRLLPQVEVLLAVPDSVVYNRNTARSVLLTTYRHQRPVIAFSQAYVTAGALAAVFSTPSQIARQAAEWLRTLPAGAALPGPKFPSYFSVAVNRYVARSLSLEVADEAALYEELLRTDGND